MIPARASLGAACTAAVLGALLLAANPLMVIFSSEALSDSPFLAFLLLGFL